MKSGPARLAGLGGILSALSWLFVILAGLAPTGRLFLFSLSSLAVLLAWLELGPLAALSVYGAVSGLSLLFPGLFPGLLFVFFFGLAPLLTLALDGRLSPLWALLLRHLLLTLLLGAGLWVVGPDTLMQNLSLPRGLFWFLLLAAYQLFLLLYNHLLRLFSQLWVTRLRPGSRDH